MTLEGEKIKKKVCIVEKLHISCKSSFRESKELHKYWFFRKKYSRMQNNFKNFEC